MIISPARAINGSNKNDAVVKAAEYCAKASDPGGTCLSKAQTTFFTHGPDRKDSVVKAADIS